jgi:hypothetical protein
MVTNSEEFVTSSPAVRHQLHRERLPGAAASTSMLRRIDVVLWMAATQRRN